MFDTRTHKLSLVGLYAGAVQVQLAKGVIVANENNSTINGDNTDLKTFPHIFSC